MRYAFFMMAGVLAILGTLTLSVEREKRSRYDSCMDACAVAAPCEDNMVCANRDICESFCNEQYDPED